ncbi:hypothetical protein D9X30_4278 [Cupriavidus sp. U2]|nr:hypothetical protein D9X30_4278 [Cupriavidus sp. U2]
MSGDPGPPKRLAEVLSLGKGMAGMKPSSLDLGQATTPMAGIMKLIHALTR